MKKSRQKELQEQLTFEEFICYISEENEIEWFSETKFSVTPQEEDATTAYYERGDDSLGWYVSEVGYPTKMRTIEQWEEIYPYTFRGW